AVVREHALAALCAGVALQAVRQRLAAELYDLRLHALGLEYADHFLQRPHGRSLRVAAAIDEQNFHAQKPPCGPNRMNSLSIIHQLCPKIQPQRRACQSKSDDTRNGRFSPRARVATATDRKSVV